VRKKIPIMLKKMESNREPSNAQSSSKPRIFKAPQGHCVGQVLVYATRFIISQLALQHLEITLNVITPPDVHSTSLNSLFSGCRSGLRIAGEGL